MKDHSSRSLRAVARRRGQRALYALGACVVGAGALQWHAQRVLHPSFLFSPTLRFSPSSRNPFSAHPIRTLQFTNLSAGSTPPPISARVYAIAEGGSGTLLASFCADLPLPPASLAKLVTCAVVMEALERGELHWQQRIRVPLAGSAQAFAPGSSLIFLRTGEYISVHDLLAGMNIASGNDAAYTLAYAVAGSIPAFCTRMNTLVQKWGLTRTRFVEPSGLSEHNVTTARDFVLFCCQYVRRWPENLARFHARSYFQRSNSPATSRIPPHTRFPATNTLLAATAARGNVSTAVPGCDGLKTGYIRESGFNVALSSLRGDTRIIAVILGGAGNSIPEGKRIRARDGATLLYWAFTHFQCTDVRTAISDALPCAIPVLGSKRPGALRPILHPSCTSCPVLNTPGTRISITFALPPLLRAPLQETDVIGFAHVLDESNGMVLARVPLVSGTTLTAGGNARRIIDEVAVWSVELWRKIREKRV
ncbi:D-alanyl-D-alanine carboxypeptidase family protein [Treponema pallidum]|uniref:D-alanyl-D-alanine carboxypeptidase family protein n=1 Tax=Treponema pallidum TaxID=160 RepID=UPI002061DC06|nr:D-alanyl-D-alanine carboxypeptidase family protein [Treponema pallidum]QUJ43768.2 D-alanyl-D-alanine carboxypeptidase [Treponema pallidum]QUK35011.2 D-alanyl-D-alanine carboxypeptidase [Treponema pallidum]QUK96123.2 D-alanyl-D-alanine carboxypeptidase [Treponema pallidum]QUL11584.2 D-alanyl-D-alanine carboxypeptidase [Treponema pallidum]WNZ37446.1 D-alanyl-D-alanine carboxypeptidase [Treponema pallidum]